MQRKIEVKPTASEMAEEFCGMSDVQQSEFLDIVSAYMGNWNPFNFESQLMGIAEHLGHRNKFVETLYEFIKEGN